MICPLDALYPRERVVLALVAEARSNKEIANQLGLSQSTVKSYVESILAKLDVPDRAGAVAIWYQHRSD